MYYIEQRIQVICNQLAHFRFRESRSLPDWQYKKGQFFRPEEAEAASDPWEKFDCQTMRWYADYAGTDQFEGKFQGQSTDFHGIPGTHYWFRSRVTIPQDFAGKSVWLRIHTQIEEWDDGKNPQFLVFVNGQVAAKTWGHFNDWRVMRFVDVSKFVRPGRNLIAVAVLNKEVGPTGLLAVLKFANGAVVPTGEGWVGSPQATLPSSALPIEKRFTGSFAAGNETRGQAFSSERGLATGNSGLPPHLK